MAKAKMNWEPTQRRWRARYRGVPIQISARKLGGKTYEDTVAAANRYYDMRVKEIDLELAQTILRPHEAEYKSELDDLTQVIQKLDGGANDPATRQALEVIKSKATKIRKALDTKTLPPFDDSLRNPLAISAKKVEQDAEAEAVEREYQDQLYQYELSKNDESWLSHNGYYSYAKHECWSKEELVEVFRAEADVSNMSSRFGSIRDVDTAEIERKLLDANNEEQKRSAVRQMVDFMNRMEMRRRATEVISDKTRIYREKKKELGIIDDFERGRITQKLQDAGVNIAESKQLLHHIDKYLEFQTKRHNQKKIKAGQLGLIVILINHYKKWVVTQGVKRVEQICTTEHVDAYFDFIDGKTRNRKDSISPSYAKKLFNAFKRFVQYLIDEEVVKDTPPWKKRTDDKYLIKEEQNTPETVPLDVLRMIYPLAPPRLQLCMLLALNCGFGASEIGQLEKNEYTPATARIKHKRVKTAEHKNVPTVTYRLWNRTQELLDCQIKTQENYPKFPKHQHLLLLNMSGKPLWEERFNGKKHQKNDNIKSQFNKFIGYLRKKGHKLPDISFYMLRKTSASAIFNNEDFGHLDWLWLGHSPKSTAAKHYTAPSPTILDRCLAWLEGAIFDDPIADPN